MAQLLTRDPATGVLERLRERVRLCLVAFTARAPLITAGERLRSAKRQIPLADALLRVGDLP